jgi:Arc/MetJ-type ribon-helix-helix transcriptional regulator
MIRSTRVQKAERLRAARRLLADEIGMAEAAMALSRTFGLSRRQAYRYLELARAGASTPSAAKNSVTITLKMPESLARGLRDRATERGVTTSEVVRQAVAAFLAAKRRHG